tara:strand:+ start:1895 stop:2068 length:174 start_codon:yes stop_codon:yes gene_type:complete
MNANEIKALREKHRLTKAEFGRLVYQTERAVYSWELGERQMPKALGELVLIKLGELL